MPPNPPIGGAIIGEPPIGGDTGIGIPPGGADGIMLGAPPGIIPPRAAALLDVDDIKSLNPRRPIASPPNIPPKPFD